MSSFLNFKRNLTLILKFSIIDLRRRFKSSILSWAWLFINPLLMLFMYWFAFSSAGNETSTITYTINGVTYNFKWIAWIIIGVFTWSYFGDVLIAGPYSIKNYSWMPKFFGINYIFPAIFVNTSKFAFNFFLIIIGWIIAIICNATDGVPNTQPFTLYSLEVPLVLLLMFLFMMGYSYLITPLCGISRDFQNLLLMLPMLLSWVSGVFLQPHIQNDNNVVNTLLQINPFNFLINGLRSTVLGYSELFTPNDYSQWYSILSFFLILILFWTGGFIINRISRKFIVDII